MKFFFQLSVSMALAVGTVSVAGDSSNVHTPVAEKQSSKAWSESLLCETDHIDAGEVLRGDAANFQFVVRNVGSSMIRIDAKPGCGCTVVKVDSAIPPGGSGSIKANLSTAGLLGRVEKTIDVTSADLPGLRARLWMKANVVSIVDIDVPGGTRVPLKAGEFTTVEYPVIVRGRDPVQITGVASSSPYAKASIIQGRSPHEKTHRLRVTIDETAPFGRSSVTLTLATSMSRDVTTMVTLHCEKGIVAAPSTLFFGAVKPILEKPIVRTVKLRSADRRVRIVGVKSTDPNLQVTHSAADGEVNSLRVSCAGAGNASGTQRGKIIVQTDDARQPIVEIPALYVVSRPNPSTGRTAGSHETTASHEKAGR